MNEYTVTIAGMRVKGKSLLVYLLIPVFLAIVYLAACASLYAFVQMFEIAEFSWMNGVYWAIIVATLAAIFGKTGGN